MASPVWIKALTRLGRHGGRGLSLLHEQMRKRLDRQRPLQIQAYRGFGTPEQLVVRGRVLKELRLRDPEPDDSMWDNVLATYRRFDTHPVPGARVEARLGTQTVEAVAGDDGYFAAVFTLASPLPAGAWYDIPLTLIEPTDPEGVPITATAEVVVPHQGAQFVVVSDIDDTILHSSATDRLKMARLTLLKNAHTRAPLPGVAQLYQALQAGPDEAWNPVVYLSNSAWNLYDLLDDFMRFNEIPTGPVLLQDIGWDRGKVVRSRHGEHKLAHLENLLEVWPLPLVLIGDTGQLDATIYAKVCEAHPHRVRAVYLRDVGDPARRKRQQAEIDRIRGLGVPVLATDDSVEMAGHAAEIGLIDPLDVDRVAAGADAEDGPSVAVSGESDL